MDTSNWRPTPGGNAGGGDSSMEADDWRSKLQEDSREMILNNIVGTLKRRVPFSEHEELKKIAMRFEEKIYNAATSQSDYLHKISLKMLSMETGPQNPMPDERQSNSAANCVNPSDPGLQSIIKQEMETSNGRHTPGGSAVGGDSSMESGDWRSTLQADSRERILNNMYIMANPNPPQGVAPLLPEGPNLPLAANNFHLDTANLVCQCPVIVEILKHHSLNRALTATAQVPAIYVHQLWRSLTLVARGQQYILRGRIGDSDVVINRDIFRRILHLPEPTAIPGRTAYDAQVSDAVLCRDIRALGHAGQLAQPSHFSRIHLQPVWYTLFTILNRCLSAINKGIDQTTVNLLGLFHAVIYSRHVDYASILWTELISQVQKKQGSRRLKFLPYPRFLQLIVAHFMATDLSIPRRIDHEVMLSTRMTRIQNKIVIEDLVPMVIPADLLAIADQTAPSVIAYRRENNLDAPMDQPDPAGPPHGARPERREDPRMRGRGVRRVGARGRGVPRENIVRGTGVGGAVRSTHDASSSRPQSTRPRTLTPLRDEDPVLHDVEVEGVSRNQVVEVAASSSSSEPGPDSESQSGSTSSSQEGSEESGSEATESDEDDDDDDTSNPKSISGVTRRAEGEIVEKEIECEHVRERSKRKNESESVMEQSSQVAPNQPPPSQAATSAIPLHPLQRGIEEDVVGLATQMHTSPSHSVFSQKETVSSSHGDLAQLPPVSHLESSGVEIREHQPQCSTSFNAQLSLAPFVETIPLARTQVVTTATVESLRASTGTPRVSLPFSSLQGQGGRPATVFIRPTVSAGGTAVQSTTTTTTERLSATGVSHPEFVSKEQMDGALKAVQSEIMQKLSDDMAFIRRAVAGKGVATEIPPAQHQIRMSSPTPTPSIQNMSVEALKAALLDKLLSQSNIDASSEADLVSILRSQSQPPPSDTSTDGRLDTIMATLIDVKKALEALTERVASLEDTCKGQVQGSKRRHDDQDDHDQHEGEKRLRLTELSTATTEPTTVTPAEPESQQQTTDSELVQDMDISTPFRETMPVSADPTVEKLEAQSEDILLLTVPERPVLELIDEDSAGDSEQ